MLCKIILKYESATYTPGSTVEGAVECVSEYDTIIKNIKVWLECNERNEWIDDQDERGDEEKGYVFVNGENSIFSLEKTLLENPHAFSAGKYIFLFFFKLPDDIPSSFTGPYGSVSYVIRAVVKGATQRLDQKAELKIKVFSEIAVNKMSEDNLKPTYFLYEKRLRDLFFQKGRIDIEICLPRTGFVPGETVAIKFIITNKSKWNIKYMKIKLRRKITYKVTKPVCRIREQFNDITTAQGPGVRANIETNFTVDVVIPEKTEVPNFAQCQLFEVCYSLQVRCIMPFFVFNIHYERWDIKMGHIMGQGVSGIFGLPLPTLSMPIPWYKPKYRRY